MTKHEAETFVFILSLQLINNNKRTREDKWGGRK